jgi:hypothetical protein
MGQSQERSARRFVGTRTKINMFYMEWLYPLSKNHYVKNVIKMFFKFHEYVLQKMAVCPILPRMWGRRGHK